ncbi:hypothetical protein HDC92_000356 [Pedobacter sp. AK017]|nr:hypothetical protein [Pedobacter sp. AK017]
MERTMFFSAMSDKNIELDADVYLLVMVFFIEGQDST